jgi:Putative Ig domain
MAPAVAKAATSVTIAWDANSDGVTTGYYVYYGTQSGQYSGYVDVKNATSAVMNAADSTATYYFAIQAYSASGDKSQMSGEVSWKPSAQAPSLLNPGSMSATVGQSVSVQLKATDPGGLALTYSASGLPPGLGVGSTTGLISGAPTTAGAYNVTATATNTANLSASQLFTWTVLAPPSPTTSDGGTTTTGGGGTITGPGNGNGGGGNKGGNGNGGVGNGNGNGNGGGGNTPIISDPIDPAGDVTPPTVSIVSPTTDPTYTTDNTMIILTGTASDDVGVVSIMWANSRGGAGSTLGTSSWATTPIDLKMGDNDITITATDAAGNTQAVTLTITRQH